MHRIENAPLTAPTVNEAAEVLNKNTTSATANIVEEEPKTEAIPSPQSPTTKPKCGTIECQDWCDNQEILAELNYIIETSYKV